MPPDDRQRSYPASARLAGFLQLLTTPGGELPDETPEILQFLEHAAAQGAVSASVVERVAEEVRRRLVADRLRSVGELGIRPLGSHLRAKRAAARLEAETVASALELEPAAYRRVEGEHTSPLQLEVPLLARIAELFGLSIRDLGEAMRQALQPPARPGPGIARSDEKDFADDVLSVAARDLLRAGRTDQDALDPGDRKLLDEKLAAVQKILEGRQEAPK